MPSPSTEAIRRGVTSYLQKEAGGTVQYTMLANRIQNHVEKYRAERRARTARQEYELVAETAADLFWTVEFPAETLSVSDGIEHFGYDAASFGPEVDIDWFFARIHPDDRERIREHYGRLLAREEAAFDELGAERGEFSEELRFERADGTYADCHGRGILLFEDGFYVADDGPGIDPGEREQVFASGYSTTSDGTGFGLSIVEEIVDAHGWNVRVTESESGGARFEIASVRFAGE